VRPHRPPNPSGSGRGACATGMQMRRLRADSRVVATLPDSARSLHMIARLIAAWPLERYQLWLAWSDGTEGAVDLEDRLREWSLDSLRDVRLFRQMTLNREPNH